MKTHTLIVATLLSFIILVSSIGRIYMPDWAYAISIVVLIVCLVYYIFKMIYNGKTRLEEGQYALTSNVTNTKSEIEKKLDDHKIAFLESLLEKQNALQQVINDCVIFVDKESAKRTEFAINKMSTLFDETHKKIQIETEAICSVEKTLKSLSEQILEKIVSDNDKIQNNLSQITADISKNRENATSLINDTTAKLMSLAVTLSQIQKESELLKTQIGKYVSEVNENIAQSNKDLSEGFTESVLQQNATLREIFNSVATYLSEKVDGVKMQGEDLSKQTASIIQQNTSLQDSVSACSTLITEKTEAINAFANRILKEGEDHSIIVNQAVDNVKNQCSTLHGLSTSVIAQLSDRTKDIKDTNALAMKELKDWIEKESSKNKETFSSNLSVTATNLSKKIEALENQNRGMSTIKDTLIQSINSLITGLQTELQQNISDINKRIIITQSHHKTTEDELEKLKTLLNTIRKYSEDNRRDISESASVGVTKPSGAKKEPVKSVPTPVKPVVNPNRTETIIDSETSFKVLNEYKDDALVQSTMYDKTGKLLYKLVYKDGQIDQSYNYDENGKLTIRQTFYSNGQVHFRYEYTDKGQKTTEFDKFGKKK